MRLLPVLVLFAAYATAQSFETGTRAKDIEAQRETKAALVRADEPDKIERAFDRIENVADRIFGSTSGFRPVIGGLVTGSGFAAGVEYYRPDLAKGNVLFRSSARASLRQYELGDVELTLPRLANDHMFAGLYAAYRNYPTLNYYGPGPRSSKNGRSDFRLEDATFEGRLGVRPTRYLSIGMTAGYLMVNVGPGTDERFAPTERAYSPAQAPGVDRQADFLRGGPFIQFDYRDHPSNPHRGGNYVASYIYYDDRTLGMHSHKKLTGEAQQYIPFFNEKRVIALRAKTQLSYRNPGQVIPFYLQPVLGGSEDLRGFRPFRFYDNNLMVMNAEYRWEVNTGLDMAVFGDAGKVFHRHAELNFADLETSAGFGLRFKSRRAVFMRWDVGFSREGFQIWIKFNPVF